MTTDELLLDLRKRGYHPFLTPHETARGVWLAWVRGGATFEDDSPQAALQAVWKAVARDEMRTTHQLRKAAREATGR